MAGFRKTAVAIASAAPLLTAAAPAFAATHTTPAKTSAQPSTVPCCGGSAHYVTWANQETGGYLHVVGGSKADGALIDTYKKSGSCADHGVTDTQCQEEWQQLSTAYSSEFAYMNVNSGLCLDDPNSAATGPKGTIHVIQYSCGNYPAQRRWYYHVATEYEYGNELYNEANQQWACVRSGSADVVFSHPFDTFEDPAGYWCGWK